MGIGVSGWRLAREVSKTGHLGVVSGVGITQVFARNLQNGDIGGHMRRALEHFPTPEIAQRVLKKYYVEAGRAAKERFRQLPKFTIKPPRELTELCVCASFTEVWLAREGHDNPVGMNLLEKIQMQHLPSLYGAMLAGVAYVLMGAGIPTQIPGALDTLALHQPSSYRLSVDGAGPEDDFRSTFDPSTILPLGAAPLKRPQFLAIISSATLGLMLKNKSSGVVNGFVVESPTAGGHNAPPRGKAQFNERGEPIYGERDLVDFAKMRELDLPFWLAGSYAKPERWQEVMATGAQGIQAGSIFALCDESGLVPAIRKELRRAAYRKELNIVTDARASSSGFPFKVAALPGSLADQGVFEARTRICDIGYLQSLYKKEDGTIGYRCSAEPTEVYVAKGGKLEATEGTKCLCNGLMADIGLPQVFKDGDFERPLVTLGDDYSFLPHLMKDENDSYSARDAIKYLESGMCNSV
jgi:nitronate monooxygenase